MIQSDWVDPCKQISNSEIPSALGIAHFIMLPLNGLSRFFSPHLFILTPCGVYKMTLLKVFQS